MLLAVLVASLVAVIRERPSLKHLGPLLLVWGLAMLMLIFIRDLGSSLMFFGGFLALLYVATGRLSLVGVGATMFLAGVGLLRQQRCAREGARGHLARSVRPRVVDDEGYQIAQSLFAQADGGLFGQGFGQALLELPGGGTILPAPHTDLIYAVVANELGLFGAVGLISVYLLFTYRGFQIAELASDGFSKLLAAGLTAVFALQVFVIVGGVTRVIPLTGVTLPFVSYGGSSIVANMVLLALLLIVSNHARAERARRGGPGLNRQIVQLFGLAVGLFAVLVLFTSRWTVFEAKSLESKTANRRPLIEEQKVPRGLILAREGTVLARSRSQGRGEDRIFTRFYPAAPLFAHAVGYSFIRNGRVGLERSRNDALAGEEDEFESILAELESREREGRRVHQPRPRGAARGARWAGRTQGRRGGDRAEDRQGTRDGLDPRSSTPTRSRRRSPRSTAIRTSRCSTAPLRSSIRPARPSRWSPRRRRSTAASSRPESIVDGTSPKTISGQPLENAGGQSFGPLSLTDALTNSVNTVWAQVGEQIGRETLVDYMDRFGFNEDPSSTTRKSRWFPAGSAMPRVATSVETRASTSGAWRSDRVASRARSGRPAADGPGGCRGRQRRQADEAAPHRSDRAQGRSRRGADRAGPAVAGDLEGVGRSARRDDDARGRGRHRHGGCARGRRRRRGRPAPPRSASSAN